MGWNHRVMKHEKTDGDDDWYQIHEVYYNNKREPNGWTQHGIKPGGNTLEELRDEPLGWQSRNSIDALLSNY